MNKDILEFLEKVRASERQLVGRLLLSAPLERGGPLRQRILDLPRRHARLHEHRPLDWIGADVRHVQKVLEVQRAQGMARISEMDL